jgi:hypothetical protein
MTKFTAVLCACGVVANSACASQTTFHTVPLGARVQINGALCGESPCVYHTRYGFPDRIHVQLEKDNFESADFYLDTEAPSISYLLLGFGSYLFHTYAQEYRFQLKPKAATGAPSPAAPANPTSFSSTSPPSQVPAAPASPSHPSAPKSPPTPPVPSPDATPPPSRVPAVKAEPSWT